MPAKLCSLALLLLASRASAHEGYPIAPVKAEIRVEPDRVVADLRTDSIFWIEEVAGLHPMPAADWPAGVRAKVEAYVNAHFRLAEGSAVLPGRLTAARYRQLPWEVNEEGVFFLTMTYPALKPGSTLTASANFFEEYRAEMAAEYAGRRQPYAADYRTELSAPGRRLLTATLTPESPSVSWPAADAARGGGAMAAEAARRGLASALGVAAAFPALLGLGLWAAATPGGLPADHLVALAACVILGSDTAIACAIPGTGRIVWPGLLLSSAAAAFANRGLGRDAAALAFFCLGAAWGAESSPLLPHSGRLASLAAAAGAAAGGLALFEAARRLGLYEREQARLISESRAGELFAARARLAASALALIGGYGLWLNLHG